MDIRVSHLTKTFGAQAAVDDVSFRAEVGVTGFLGPNGAGKSTTMRMITGFLQPSGGEVTLGGEQAWPTRPAVRRCVGYLPEHNPLYTELYVREYLRYVASLHGVGKAKARVDEVIERVGLTREVNKVIGQLSKGYRQRVGLAQAIVHDPPVVILDEPTNGFDPNQLADIRALIRELGQTKVVLLSTHIMQEVQALCQRVLIIDGGRLVADDPIERLGDIGGRGKIIRVRCERFGDLRLLRDLSGVKSVQQDGNQLTLTVRSDRELRPEIAAVIAADGWGLLELSAAETDIEGVFQSLTRAGAPPRPSPVA